MVSRWLMQVMAYSLGTAAALPFPASSTAQQTQSGEAMQQQSTPNGDGNIPVIRSTTTLVYLDVTVLDKKGHPVVKGLTQDDFSITEDKKPERIFSFEEPEAHDGKSGKGEVPKTVLLLDLLNTPFSDFAYVRDQAQQFLLDQPDELNSETELMVVGNQTTELLQGFTRSQKDLLFALDHLPRMLPSKLGPDWKSDRIRQSYIALQQISVQNRGLPGRKNVMWIGSGSPNLPANEIPDPDYDKVQQYLHRMVNMMVESRISLFLIYPKFRVGFAKLARQASNSTLDENTPNPFSGSSFTEFVYETGGKVFDLNDVSREIDDSVQLGSKYYTLTYQPPDDKIDGGFRRIQVKLRNPELHVMTKAGFFARNQKEAAESDDKTLNMLTEASLAAIPMKALQVSLAQIVRHPDAKTVEITVQLDDNKLGWEAAERGLSNTFVIVTAVSRSGFGDVLASKVGKYELTATSQDASRLANVKPEIKFTLRLPRSTKNVRVAIATRDGERIGALDLSRKDIDAAPATLTPDPRLLTPRNRVAQEAN